MDWIEAYPVTVMAILAVLTLAVAVVAYIKWTPTKKDDKLLKEVLTLIVSLVGDAAVKRLEERLEESDLDLPEPLSKDEP